MVDPQMQPLNRKVPSRWAFGMLSLAVGGVFGLGGMFVVLGVLILTPIGRLIPPQQAAAPADLQVTLPVQSSASNLVELTPFIPAVPTLTPTVEPTHLPTLTATPVPTLTPTPVPLISSGLIGYSVLGKPLETTAIGYGPQNLVIMGAIHGEEGNTADLVMRLKDYFAKNPRLVTAANARLFLLPVINPDGAATKARLNAHRVNLDTNWATANWQVDSLGYGGKTLGGGGPAPFSEPETQAISSLLLDLAKSSSRPVRVIFYHSAYPSGGMAQAAYTLSGGAIVPDPATARLAQVYAQNVGSLYLTRFDYPITGEAIHWCGENQIQCIDVELPSRANVSAPLFERHISGILAILK